MASNKPDTPSVTGLAETAEPNPISSPSNHPSDRHSASPILRREPSTTPVLRKQPSVSLKSPGSSGYNSRNTSPIRPSLRQESSQHATKPAFRSRKNSHDASPSRPLITTPPPHSVPSAAAIQRALSATTVPQLQLGPVAEAVSRLPRTSRNPASADGTPTTGSLSPRVKSPPPTAPASRRNSFHNNKNPIAAPPITVQASTPPTVPTNTEAGKGDSAAADKEQLRAPGKAPSRGPSGPKSNLETVQENTPPAGGVPANDAESRYAISCSLSSSMLTSTSVRLTCLR